MKTKLLILGCGSSVGVPRIDGVWGKCKKNNKRNIRSRSSAIIIKGTNSILIDTSADLRYQLLSNKIRNISSVILTHEHADQTNGIFELRPFFWKYKKKINVYGDAHTMRSISKRHDYLFKRVGSYPPIVKSNIIKSKFSLGKSNEKVFFKTIKVRHGKGNSLAYIFEKTAYISDTDDLSIIKMSELKNLKYLIIDCLKLKKHPTHFNLEESLFVHKKLKPKKTILTNLHYDLDYNYLLKRLPKNIIPAYDGLKITL
jgi:phosphoribosyl 1,2-cyclic phosphate phosphodiesterase|tara:strand:- start:1838 stop:2608 length:771 start_codon:yes stop_codon:yes gene_type:complete